MTSSEIGSLTQSQMQAWGTGGLHPHELRAVYFALQRSPPSGRPAQQFIARLKDRVASLPPPDEADEARAASSGDGDTTGTGREKAKLRI